MYKTRLWKLTIYTHRPSNVSEIGTQQPTISSESNEKCILTKKEKQASEPTREQAVRDWWVNENWVQSARCMRVCMLTAYSVFDIFSVFHVFSVAIALLTLSVHMTSVWLGLDVLNRVEFSDGISNGIAHRCGCCTLTNFLVLFCCCCCCVLLLQEMNVNLSVVR